MKTRFFSLGLSLTLVTVAFAPKSQAKTAIAYRPSQPFEIEFVSAADFYHQANQLLNSQEYQKALAAYEQAIALDADYYYAWWGKGYVLQELGEYFAAIAAYDRAITINDQDAKLWFAKGFILYKTQEYEGAISA
ncbi:MAG: tetratricopeptide repeat protein, partial [Cyanobacteria bacterium J06623_7]